MVEIRLKFYLPSKKCHATRTASRKRWKIRDATRKSGRINPQLAPFPTKIATSGYPPLWCKCIPSYYILLDILDYIWLYAHCWLVLYLNLYISPSATPFISLSHTNMGLSERRVPSKFMVYHVLSPCTILFPSEITIWWQKKMVRQPQIVYSFVHTYGDNTSGNANQIRQASHLRLSKMGLPPVIIHFSRGFSMLNHPAISGIPMARPQIWIVQPRPERAHR